MSHRDQSQPQPHFSLLLENESGVMEVFLKTIPVEQGVMFRSIGSIALTGQLKPTDPDQVIEAAELFQWTVDNNDVFEGRVCPETESAN